MVFPVVGGDGKPTGYEIDNSLRFDYASNAKLAQTFSSAGNRRTWTWSGWIKRTKFGQIQAIFSCINSTPTYYTQLRFEADDTLTFHEYPAVSSSANGVLKTTQVFRDVSAWYHVVINYDSGNAVANDRARMYINGERVTSFGTEVYPSQNQDGIVGSNANIGFGRYISYGTGYFDGYLAEIIVLDGSGSYTDVGESKNGVWIPKDPSGLTFGNNGYYLKFNNASSLGADSSGNSNDFTANNMGTDHQVLDSPTFGS